YLIAVSAPGGLDLLKSGLAQPAANGAAAENRVFVAVESAPIWTPDGVKTTAELRFGDVVEVAGVRDSLLLLTGQEHAIQQRDVVPLRSMVTRIVDLDPPSVSDKMDPRFYDHPHHKGVWVAVDEVNGVKFWKEDGHIENVSVEVLANNAAPAVLRVVNRWLNDAGEHVVTETTTIRITPDRLFVYDIQFTAGDSPATFEDTKEGLFAIRLPNSMREYVSHGPVRSAEGKEGTKAAWGRESAWIDYVGAIDGQQFGVTLLDAPNNPWPSRYHVRDYGLFSINPFGTAAYSKGSDNEQPARPLTLDPGKTISFRYGLHVHQGVLSADELATLNARFVQAGE
ncbi:MAG: PmoA family protein, partial [Planctomycetaceae bacterium]